jgi:hypothetical protein
MSHASMAQQDYHTTKDGQEIPMRSMTDAHLKNTIAWIERKAKSGMVLKSYIYDPFGSDHDYDEKFIDGAVVLEYLSCDKYKHELNKRGLN